MQADGIVFDISSYARLVAVKVGLGRVRAHAFTTFCDNLTESEVISVPYYGPVSQ